MDDSRIEAERARGELRALRLALVMYVAMKLAAYFATGVMALMAEALHTLSDVFAFCGARGLMLHGMLHRGC